MVMKGLPHASQLRWIRLSMPPPTPTAPSLSFANLPPFTFWTSVHPSNLFGCVCSCEVPGLIGGDPPGPQYSRMVTAGRCFDRPSPPQRQPEGARDPSKQAAGWRSASSCAAQAQSTTALAPPCWVGKAHTLPRYSPGCCPEAERSLALSPPAHPQHRTPTPAGETERHSR